MIKKLKERIWLLVVIITALSSCLAIGLTSAKYYSEYTGTGSMQAASFDVSVTGTPTDFSLSETTQSASFDFTVTSNSEVAVTYDVVITLPTGATLPDGVTFDNIVTFSIGEKTATKDSTGLIYTITSVGAFTANGGANEHTLTVTAKDFSNDINLTDIQIRVVATQAQPSA